MKNIKQLVNPYNEDKVICNCSLFGMMSLKGEHFSGKTITTAIGNMHERGNGLGGGFAVYGIYPDYADCYAFHIAFNTKESRNSVECFLRDSFEVVRSEEVPTRQTDGIVKPPLVTRYFLKVRNSKPDSQTEDDFVVEKVMEINTTLVDAFVFSSGKNMGVFKGVGYPEQISHYFCLEDYEGYLWTAHGRFPTNTQAWWGGAHPFSVLDWTVVHNGEISSYGTNRSYLEMFGYHCTMYTDTEVMAYAVDLLMRRHELPVEIVAKVFAPPFWTEIDRMSHEEQNLYRTLRQVYASLLMNGPFTVIVAHQGEMIGLTDRIRLRPLVAGLNDDTLYLSSEESAIRLVCADVGRTWIPHGGEPIVGKLLA
jgi:glutamate synthase domain-containing protein 1